MTKIDFDAIAANADRSLHFRQVYRDVHRLTFFLRRWKATGEYRWNLKAGNYYRRLRIRYPDDSYAYRMKCIASELAGVDAITW